MTREVVTQGRPEPGQEPWPEQAKETVRNMVLVDNALQVWRNTVTTDKAGDTTENWEKHGELVRGRIDEKWTSPQGVIAEQIEETATHIISTDPSVDVTQDDRVEIEGKMWVVLTKLVRTEQATIQLHVREL